MSEHFNPFDEREEDDEVPAYAEQAPEVPEPPEEQSFFERVREILRLDEEDDDDDLEAVPPRRGIFRRFFVRVPGVVAVQPTEELPVSQPVEAEAPIVEHSFALPFVELANTLDPVEAEPVTPSTPVIEAYTEIAIETTDSEAEPVVMYEVDEVILTETPSPEGDVEQEVEIEPVVFGLETIAIGGPTEVAPPPPAEAPDEPAAISRRDAKKIAEKASQDATKKATTQAKKREQKVADGSKKRDTALARKLEALKQDNQTLEDQLRQRLRSEQAIVPDVVASVERAPMPRQVETIETPAPVLVPVSPERTVYEDAPVEIHSESNPSIPYTPERHDKIPPKQAFEQLTGMEVPLPRTLEQERRFEVKDEASTVPVAYTQVNASQSQGVAPVVAPQATRSALVGLGPSTDNPHAADPARSPDPTYKQAVVSGLVTAVVLLAVLIAWSFFF